MELVTTPWPHICVSDREARHTTADEVISFAKQGKAFVLVGRCELYRVRFGNEAVQPCTEAMLRKALPAVSASQIETNG